jgi:hypothetical protein
LSIENSAHIEEIIPSGIVCEAREKRQTPEFQSCLESWDLCYYKNLLLFTIGY